MEVDGKLFLFAHGEEAVVEVVVLHGGEFDH